MKFKVIVTTLLAAILAVNIFTAYALITEAKEQTKYEKTQAYAIVSIDQAIINNRTAEEIRLYPDVTNYGSEAMRVLNDMIIEIDENGNKVLKHK